MHKERRRNKPKTPIACEVLEDRMLLSSVSVDSGVLTVKGDRADNQITVNDDNVSVDGEVATFDPAFVNQIVIYGFRGDDVLENRSEIDSVILGGRGNDVIRGGAGNDRMFGQAGHDFINDFGGDNLLSGGRGNDTLQDVSSGVSIQFGGRGNDSLYAIVGAPNTTFSGPGRDQIIVRKGVDTHDANRKDSLIAFDLNEQVPTLRDGVLYVNGGGNTFIFQHGNRLSVLANGQFYSFRANQVDSIAGIASNDDDLLVNNTNKPLVYYGIGGNDTIIGGGGNDLIKGGGGNDLLFGRGGQDDISGDPGADLIFGGRGKDTLRRDALDTVFARPNDLLIFQ